MDHESHTSYPYIQGLNYHIFPHIKRVSSISINARGLTIHAMLNLFMSFKMSIQTILYLYYFSSYMLSITAHSF